MLHVHDCSFHTHARVDPTKTIMLRRRYEQDLVRRFNRLAKEVMVGVGAEDKLVLNAMPRFDFPRSGRKVAAFMDWLDQQVNAGILEIITGTPVESAASKHWQNVYLRSAYTKGLQHAAGQMRKGGIGVSEGFLDDAFFRPIHADRAGLIFTRTFNTLKGITNAMSSEISRVLAQSIIEGRGPMEVARLIVDRIKKIGIVRARMLARTEIIRAHALATINGFKEAGIKGVKVKAEFQTARDEKVCPKCQELEGKVFTLEEAEPIIPVHPNCRCAWIPHIDDALKELGIEI